LLLSGVLFVAPATAATVYTYDELGRLKTATYDDGKQIVYSYDAAGNRSQTVISAGTPPNRPPVAANVLLPPALSDGTLAHAFPLVHSSDPDGDALTVSGVGPAQHGTTSHTSTRVQYAANSGYTGIDSFTYTISDGHGGTATATASVNVVWVNSPPTAVNDTATVNINTATPVYVLANDTDPNGDTLSVASVTQPAHGGVTIQGVNNFFTTYTPAAGYVGPDSYTYTMSDGHGGTGSATVSVTVVQPNRPPSAFNDQFGASIATPKTFDPRTNDVDPDGDALTIIAAGPAVHGTVTVAANKQSVTYTGASGYSGLDTFGYTISDPYGATGKAADTVAVGLPLPVAVNDNMTVTGTVGQHPAPVSIDPRTNDVPATGTTLTVTGKTDGSLGAVTVAPDGSAVTYQLNRFMPDSGTDSFTYTITDSLGHTATGTVNVTLQGSGGN
jgi:YD repeat-containing protein